MPTAEIIAAHALINRLAVREAAENLEATISEEIRGYVETLVSFAETHLDSYFMSALQRFVAEGDTVARLEFPTEPDTRPRLREQLAKEEDAERRGRMKKGKGRPRGSGDFLNHQDFIVTALEVMQSFLEWQPEIPISEETVAPRLGAWAATRKAKRRGKPVPEPDPDHIWDDRKLRYLLDEAGVKWEDLKRAAIAIHRGEIMYANWVDRMRHGIVDKKDK